MSFARSTCACTALLLLSGLVPAGWSAPKQAPPQAGEETVPGEFLVRFQTGTPTGFTRLAFGSDVDERQLDRLRVRLLKIAPGLASVLQRWLENQAQVVSWEANRVRRSTLINPDDPNYGIQWALQTVKALEAWKILPNRYLTSATAGAGRIKVAVLDTGADCTHPDFKNLQGTSTDSALGGQLAFASSQAFVPTTIPAPACAWADDHGHGTHVSGTVGAATNNAIGVSALGYPVEVMVFKVLDASGSGSDSVIADAITAAADAGARVISLSLGGSGYSQTLQDAANYARERNSLVVAAAGNSNSNTLFFPAAANHVIGVAATDSVNNKASFSNWGPSVDIAAPGVGILSTTRGGGYGLASGTSMATPHVSAIAGLIAMTTPQLSAAAVAQRIQQSAFSSIANGGWDQQLGYGIIHAQNAFAGTFRPATVGGLVGQVVDAQGLPLSGATVTAGGQSVITSFSGLYRFSNLAAGLYPVAASANQVTVTVSAVITPGADTTLTIPFGAPLGQFKGTVMAGGLPATGAIVEAIAGGLIKAAAAVSATGQYELWAPAGTYDLRASGVSLSTLTVPSQTVAAGGSKTVSLSPGKLGVVTGVVRDAAGNAISDAQVSILGPVTAGAVTDVFGVYRSLGLPAGSYTATASAPGGSSAAGTVSLTNGSVFTLDLTIGDISVTVTPGSATAWPGKTVSFAASVTGTANQAVTWSISPPAGAISATGVYTPPPTLSGVQTITVKATSVAFPERFGAATLKLSDVLTLTLSPSSVTGGTTTSAHSVQLLEPAPAGGAVVTLQSLNPVTVPVPPTVTVLEGATNATFSIKPGSVSNSTPVIVSATYGGRTRQATLTVLPPALSSVVPSPSTLAGGATASSSKVYLTGPAGPGGFTVTLQSLDPDYATVPPSVVVPEGAASSLAFSITTHTVDAIRTVTIQAQAGGVTKTATITLRPAEIGSLTLSPANLVGGASSVANKVTLTGPAGPGGATVALTNPAPGFLTMPVSVVVPAGATASANFTIATKHVPDQQIYSISASYGGVSKTVALTVSPVTLSSVTLSPTATTGGNTTTGNRVNLTGPAAPTGTVVTLGSLNTGVATVPGTVTVPPGATWTTFTLTTIHVPSTKTVTVTAQLGSASKQAVLTVNPTVVTSLISPSSLIGGRQGTSNRVYLNGPAPAGGAVVALQSTNTNAATVPPTVTVPAGATTSPYFTISTLFQTQTQTTQIRATYGGVTKEAALTITPVVLSSIVVSPSSTTGGLTTTASTINLNSPAGPGGLTVALSSSAPSVASPSQQVVVPAGATYTRFNIKTFYVSQSQTVTITSSYNGTVRTAQLTLVPPALASLTIAPGAVVGGFPTTSNRVTLTAPAGPGGAVVTLSGSDVSVQPPATVTIPPGATTSANFAISTGFVSSTKVVTLTATMGGVSKQQNLTINPTTPASLVLGPTSVKAGVSTSSNRVYLNGPAPPGGFLVTLTTSDTALTHPPPSVLVPAGATYSPVFTIATAATKTASAQATISATANGVTRSATLTVTP